MNKRAIPAGIALLVVIILGGCASQGHPASAGVAAPINAGPVEAAPAAAAPPLEPRRQPAGEDDGRAREAEAEPWTLPFPEVPGDMARNGALVLVSPAHAIYPMNYRPAGLVRVSGHYVAAIAAEPLQELLDAARAAGLQLRTRSGFRSYERQHEVMANSVAAFGAARAAEVVAQPGHSEHQTGLAVDLLPMYGHECGDMACFGDTPHAAWLAEHAPEFGFIIRYERDTKHITGIDWEPWHVRYIGREAAAAYRDSGTRTLEEFLGVR